ncbi:hypothetical protein ACIQI7_27410 [Kitasatospora sp. NPDC092039]
MLSALRRQHALVALITDPPANPGATAPVATAGSLLRRRRRRRRDLLWIT